MLLLKIKKLSKSFLWIKTHNIGYNKINIKIYDKGERIMGTAPLSSQSFASIEMAEARAKQLAKQQEGQQKFAVIEVGENDFRLAPVDSAGKVEIDNTKSGKAASVLEFVTEKGSTGETTSVKWSDVQSKMTLLNNALQQGKSGYALIIARELKTMLVNSCPEQKKLIQEVTLKLAAAEVFRGNTDDSRRTLAQLRKEAQNDPVLTKQLDSLKAKSDEIHNKQMKVYNKLYHDIHSDIEDPDGLDLGNDGEKRRVAENLYNKIVRHRETGELSPSLEKILLENLKQEVKAHIPKERGLWEKFWEAGKTLDNIIAGGVKETGKSLWSIITLDKKGIQQVYNNIDSAYGKDSIIGAGAKGFAGFTVGVSKVGHKTGKWAVDTAKDTYKYWSTVSTEQFLRDAGEIKDVAKKGTVAAAKATARAIGTAYDYWSTTSPKQLAKDFSEIKTEIKKTAAKIPPALDKIAKKIENMPPEKWGELVGEVTAEIELMLASQVALDAGATLLLSRSAGVALKGANMTAKTFQEGGKAAKLTELAAQGGEMAKVAKNTEEALAKIPKLSSKIEQLTTKLAQTSAGSEKLAIQKELKVAMGELKQATNTINSFDKISTRMAKNTYNNVRGMNATTLKADIPAQKALQNLSRDVNIRMKNEIEALIGHKVEGNPKQVGRLIQKMGKEKKTVEEIKDIARGRLNLQTLDEKEMRGIVKKLEKKYGAKVKEVKDEALKALNDPKADYKGRIHVILEDSSGMKFELQIGPKQLSKFYDTEFALCGKNKNIHDAFYKGVDLYLKSGQELEKAAKVLGNGNIAKGKQIIEDSLKIIGNGDAAKGREILMALKAENRVNLSKALELAKKGGDFDFNKMNGNVIKQLNEIFGKLPKDHWPPVLA